MTWISRRRRAVAASLCATLVVGFAGIAIPTAVASTMTSTSSTSTSTSTTSTTTPASATTTVPKHHHKTTTTTTTIKPGTGVPSTPTGDKAPSSAPTTTTPAAVLAAEQSAAAIAVDDNIARLDAITTYNDLRRDVSRDRLVIAAADRYLASAEQAAGQATRVQHRAASGVGAASDNLAQLAVAAYTGAAYVNPDAGPDAIEATGGAETLQGAETEIEDADVLIAVVTTREEQLVKAAHHTLAHAIASRAAAAKQEAAAEKLVATDDKVLATTEADMTNARAAAESPAALGAANAGPSILGPSLVSAAELAGWFESTGRHANTTVPIGQLADDYITAGQKTGVRGDLAFAQSIVETGYFDFPAGGQLAGGDNNFAGIGACDSCAHGWSFPDALTGVTAQMELLDAYATPHPVDTALIGSIGVGGCCPTWMGLSGHWATNPAYGIEILDVYRQILDWAVPKQLAAASLAAAGT